MKRGQPQAIADVLGDLLARRGFARVHAANALETAWRETAGQDLASHTRLAGIKRGRLEIVIDNSVLLQEMTYRKSELLKQLIAAAPEAGIGDLKFTVGPVNAGGESEINNDNNNKNASGEFT